MSKYSENQSRWDNVDLIIDMSHNETKSQNSIQCYGNVLNLLRVQNGIVSIVKQKFDQLEFEILTYPLRI